MSYSSKYTRDEKKIRNRISDLQNLIYGNKHRVKIYAAELKELQDLFIPKYMKRNNRLTAKEEN